MIIAGEWYKEFQKNKAAGLARDMEMDALNADEVNEKIYEYKMPK